MTDRYVRADLAELWSDVDLFRQIDHLGGTTYRELAGRRTSRVKLLGGSFFLKRHWGVGWGEILKSLVFLRLPVLSARNEFEAARALAAVGVPVPEPIAFAVRGINPANLDSFVLSQAIEPSISLEDLVASWDCAPATPMQRRHLIAAVAEMVRRMHAAGVNHRDLYICHFLLRQDSRQDSNNHQAKVADRGSSINASSEKLSLTLIDLHRAQVRASVPTRWLVKDLGALLFSVLKAPIKERDLLAFVKVYCAQGQAKAATAAQLRFELTDTKRQVFWGQVRRRAARLYEEALRKQLVSGAPAVRLDG